MFFLNDQLCMHSCFFVACQTALEWRKRLCNGIWECRARTKAKEVLELKKQKLHSKEDLILFVGKILRKVKKVLYLKTPKEVQNGQFIPFMPGDNRGMNACVPDDLCIDQILLNDVDSSLCHWLCISCNEARKERWATYTLRSPRLEYVFSSIFGIRNQVESSLWMAKLSIFQPLHLQLDLFCILPLQWSVESSYQPGKPITLCATVNWPSSDWPFVLAFIAPTPHH